MLRYNISAGRPPVRPIVDQIYSTQLERVGFNREKAASIWDSTPRHYPYSAVTASKGLPAHFIPQINRYEKEFLDNSYSPLGFLFPQRSHPFRLPWSSLYLLEASKQSFVCSCVFPDSCLKAMDSIRTSFRTSTIPVNSGIILHRSINPVANTL